MGAGFWSEWLVGTVTLLAALVLLRQLVAVVHRGLCGDPFRFGLMGALATTSAVCVLVAAATSGKWGGLLTLLTIPFILLLLVGLLSYTLGRGHAQPPPTDEESS